MQAISSNALKLFHAMMVMNIRTRKVQAIAGRLFRYVVGIAIGLVPNTIATLLPVASTVIV